MNISRAYTWNNYLYWILPTIDGWDWIITIIVETSCYYSFINFTRQFSWRPVYDQFNQWSILHFIYRHWSTYNWFVKCLNRTTTQVLSQYPGIYFGTELDVFLNFVMNKEYKPLNMPCFVPTASINIVEYFLRWKNNFGWLRKKIIM